jgi:methylmalonyl-CoA mutase cobalamin-binding domain/chain
LSPLRFVTAASLFDGHDAAINIMRRLIQAQGVEVIHLGHNRSVEDVVRAALQEDADAIALSSYQGGHVEYFKYMIDMLKERGAGHIRVFGGGGGTITPEEISELQAHGVERLYHPTRTEVAFDAALGLAGLDTAATGSIATLRESFLSELAAQNTALEQVTRDAEPSLMTEAWRRRADRGRGAGAAEGDNPIHTAMSARFELEARYRAQLEALLTPEQVAQLPGVPMARDGGRPGPQRPSSDENLRRTMRERFDTNGDGQLDQQEIEKAKESHRRGPGADPPAEGDD